MAMNVDVDVKMGIVSDVEQQLQRCKRITGILYKSLKSSDN